MSWITFIVGLVVGIVITIVLVLGWLLRELLPHHRSIRSYKKLQQALATFLEQGKHRDYRFLYHLPDGLRVRVIKYVRKTMPNALVIEVRRAENPQHYASLCADLQRRGIRYEERFTPQRKDPKLIRMKFDDEAAGIVSSTSQVIEAMYETLHGPAQLDLKMNDVPPY